MSTALSTRGVVARLPRPTRSTALFLLLAVILELLGRLIHSTGVTLAAAAAVGAVIGDGILSPRVDGITVQREAPDRFALGIATQVRVSVSTPRGRRGARRSVVIRDEHPALTTGRVVTPALSGGGRASATYDVVAAERGYWPIGGEITVEAYSPLGGFVRRRTITVDDELWVHPAPAPPYRLPDVVAGIDAGTAVSPRSGQGVDFFGIREWRTGDALTAVHWRASARRRHPVVMERERPAHTALLVACHRPTDGAAWEPALGRAAATTIAALRIGRKVALVGDGDITQPRSASEVLDWFAGLSRNTTVGPELAREAARTIGGATTLLWLSDERQPDWVRRGGFAAATAPLDDGGRR